MHDKREEDKRSADNKGIKEDWRREIKIRRGAHVRERGDEDARGRYLRRREIEGNGRMQDD